MSSNKRNPVAVGRRSPVSNSYGPKQQMGHSNSNSYSSLKPMAMVRNGHHSPSPTDSSNMNGLEKRSSSAGKDEVLKMNLMAIRKVDPNVLGIVSTVPQVVLYQYESSSNEWERTSTEGTLFIYSRNYDPCHGFVILNRLSSENMQRVITSRMEFRVQHPFVLFKGEAGEIYGLCFQEESVCRETGDLLNSLSHQLTSAMRSSSAPVFEAIHRKIDMSELIDHETTSRNYLGQTFSDSASSPDSLTSEPLPSFVNRSSTAPASTAPPSTSAPFTKSTPRSQKGRGSSSQQGEATPKQLKNFKSGGGGKNMRSTSPKNIPGVKVTSKRDVGRSVSPVKQKSMSSQKLFSQSYGGGQLERGGKMMHRGASFDQSYNYHANRENSPISLQQGSFSPHKSVVSSGTQKGGANAEQDTAQSTKQRPSFVVSDTLKRIQEMGQTDHSGSSDQSPSKEHGNRIVRQLFASKEEEQTVPTSTISVTLQNLFSQAGASGVSYSNPPIGVTQLMASSKKPMPLKAVSLDEIEKQIVAEAPSPEIINPPITFNVASAHSQPGDTSNVLLQPSVFTSTGSSTATTGSQVKFNISSGSVSVAVEPPTPVSVEKTFGNSLSSGALNTSQTFPSIPPVIHSPGMRAAPISTAVSKGVEPSSLATTRSQPVATTHQQVEKPNQKKKEVGMPSRAYSEPVMPNVTAQYNPSLNPLSELSISPHKSPVPVSSALMSPQQFTQNQKAAERQSDVKQQDATIAGLSKEQLQQALIYLIKHDDDFVGKLHQAYQQSLFEKNT